MFKEFKNNFYKINIKTVYFNFRYLPFKQAIKLPVFISRYCFLWKMEGKIIIQSEIKPGLIQIGYGEVSIFDKKRSRSIWYVKGTVIFKGKTRIGHGSKISVDSSAILELGNNFNITAESTIDCSKNIRIGNNCLFSWDILIMDSDYHKIFDQNEKIINPSEEIIIGNNVWIGCRSLILKGARIDNGVVISANTLIYKKLEGENCVYGSNPNKKLRDNIIWKQ